MEEEIKQFCSYCKSCIFATHNGQHEIQKGCQLDRVDTFKKQSRTRMSKDHTHYIIDGICNANRGEEWKKAHDGQDLVVAVQKEISIGIDIVLLSIEDEEKKIVKLLNLALKSCVKQTIQPNGIVIVIKNDNVNFRELYSTIIDTTQPYDIKFQLVKIADEESDLSDCVSAGIDKCKSQFTTVFDLKTNIPHNLIETFDNIINVELKKVVLVEPICGFSGMLVSTRLFKLLGKNINMPIFTKIKEVSEIQNKTDMTITWNQLWNQE